MAKLVRYRIELMVEDDTEIDTSHADEISEFLKYSDADGGFSMAPYVKSVSVQCMKIEADLDEGKI